VVLSCLLMSVSHKIWWKNWTSFIGIYRDAMFRSGRFVNQLTAIWLVKEIYKLSSTSSIHFTASQYPIQLTLQYYIPICISNLFPWDSQTRILHAFIISPMRVTLPANLSLLMLTAGAIILKRLKQSKGYRLWSILLCDILHYLATSSFSGPNVQNFLPDYAPRGNSTAHYTTRNDKMETIRQITVPLRLKAQLSQPAVMEVAWLELLSFCARPWLVFLHTAPSYLCLLSFQVGVQFRNPRNSPWGVW
jgi:hypothetical protein